MKHAFYLLIICSFSISSLAATYSLSDAVKNGHSAAFQSHEGLGAFDSYLVMNLPYSPMLDLFQQVTTAETRTLINRGEAHITVITPVEYWNALRPQGVSMSEINDIARTMDIQGSDFNILCLGRGSASINGVTEHTFYVVVESTDLMNLRREIEKLFVSKGGSLGKFDATKYYPHITLGFTSRDLFESDGVFKDSNSCIGRIELTTLTTAITH